MIRVFVILGSRNNDLSILLFNRIITHVYAVSRNRPIYTRLQASKTPKINTCLTKSIVCTIGERGCLALAWLHYLYLASHTASPSGRACSPRLVFQTHTGAKKAYSPLVHNVLFCPTCMSFVLIRSCKTAATRNCTNRREQKLLKQV